MQLVLTTLSCLNTDVCKRLLVLNAIIDENGHHPFGYKVFKMPLKHKFQNFQGNLVVYMQTITILKNCCEFG